MKMSELFEALELRRQAVALNESSLRILAKFAENPAQLRAELLQLQEVLQGMISEQRAGVLPTRDTVSPTSVVDTPNPTPAQEQIQYDLGRGRPWPAEELKRLYALRKVQRLGYAAIGTVLNRKREEVSIAFRRMDWTLLALGE
jgi:hypothetical protein